MNRGEFSLIVEVNPPKGTDLTPFIDSVLSIKGRVTAVAVTDGTHAIMRMTPLAPCRMLIERNVEPVMILNGRDRNRISFQGDILGASAMGVRNLLLKEGQDPAVGDQPMAQAGSDLDLNIMLQCVSSLNEGQDLGGEALDGKTDMRVGAYLDVSDDVQVNRRTAESIPELSQKGVSFVVLGPTYDMNLLDLFARSSEDAGVKLLASVMLLKSVAMIRYLNDLPGVPSVPHEFLKKLMQAPVKQQTGMEIAASLIEDMQDRCQGAVLIALGWGSRLPEFLDLLGR
jgi:5,10-methylenetetrahydrofolate reductase